MTMTERPHLPGEAHEDTELLDGVVRGIREIHLRKGLEYYLEVGQFVIDHLFEGDASAVSTRSKGHRSFRALATRDDLPMSYVSLYAAVRVRQQYATLPAAARASLTMGHHRALLPLRTTDDRASLAQEASEKAWTVEQLKQRVRDQLDADRHGARRGRKPLPPFQKTLHRMKRALDADGSLDGLDLLDASDTEKATALQETVTALLARLSELDRGLRAAIEAERGGR